MGDTPETGLTADPPVVVAGYVEASRQLLDEAQRIRNAERELEWIALHYDAATPEQRARLDAFIAAVEEREDRD